MSLRSKISKFKKTLNQIYEKMDLISFSGFDKCERCRKSPAIIECTECGTSQRALKMCYDCDKNHHISFADKENRTHNRVPIKFQSKPSYQSLMPYPMSKKLE